GTAGSTSAANVDVAKMHPPQSAKIDNSKREKKQYCIQFVEMARPNLFSRCGGVGQSTQHKGTLASRIPKRVLSE
ncbi:MAG: hypothetical protein DME72_02935, partial [Verrucomicrobia bacterium]